MNKNPTNMLTQTQIMDALNRRHSPEKQRLLSEGHVAIAGLGGLGSNVACALARIGVGHQLFFRKIFQNTVDKHSFCYGIVKGFTDDGGIGKKFPEIFSGYPDAVCADIQIWIDLFQQ